MKVLLDHNVPVQLIPRLAGHEVFSAYQVGWNELKNGQLLLAAHQNGFDAMVTGDQNLIYQQNNSKRLIAIVLLSEIKRRLILADADVIRLAIERSRPGGFERVSIRSILQPIPVE